MSSLQFPGVEKGGSEIRQKTGTPACNQGLSGKSDALSTPVDTLSVLPSSAETDQESIGGGLSSILSRWCRWASTTVSQGKDEVQKLCGFTRTPMSNLTHRLDPLVYENALKILNLLPGEDRDSSHVTQVYRTLVTALDGKRAQVPPLLAREFSLMLQDAQAAYQTVTAQMRTL